MSLTICFRDADNLEESCSLSRLIKLLNPKLENKKGKDCFYQFRDMFGDLFIAQLGEYLRSYLSVTDLESDVTPSHIASESDPNTRQERFLCFFP